MLDLLLANKALLTCFTKALLHQTAILPGSNEHTEGKLSPFTPMESTLANGELEPPPPSKGVKGVNGVAYGPERKFMCFWI